MPVRIRQFVNGELTGEWTTERPAWAESDRAYLEAKANKDDWPCAWEGDVLHTWKEYEEGPVRRKDRYFEIV